MADWFSDAFDRAAKDIQEMAAGLGTPFDGAVSDIRSKLIDEAWFGRRTTDREQQGDLGWSLDDRPKTPAAPKAPEERDQSHDFDR
jgi:hypothetical protein